MRSGQFQYEVVAQCAPERALALLADPTRQVALHPLIRSVVARPAPAGIHGRYAITDQLAWGPLRFRITYEADVLTVEPGQVVTVARQWPRTTVRNETTIHGAAGGTRIDVVITLTAPGPLFPYAFRQARTAHAGLAARIPEALVNGPSKDWIR